MYLARHFLVAFCGKFQKRCRAATPAKANFHQSHTLGELIRVWWIELHSLRGVHRSPDWLTHRPIRWLSCRRRFYFYPASRSINKSLHGRPGEMVSAQILYIAHFNYRNPIHKIYCSLQGNRRSSGKSANSCQQPTMICCWNEFLWLCGLQLQVKSKVEVRSYKKTRCERSNGNFS